MSNVILTLTGPSGSGKTTLEKLLKQREGFTPLISTTTRNMREGEVNGVNYHFMDKSQFKRLAEQGAFVENVQFNGELYGMTKSEVAKFNDPSHPPGVFVCDPHGKEQIEAYAKEAGLKALRVFIDVNSQEQMERLLDRFNDEVDAGKYGKYKAYEDIVKSFASRMVLVAGVEQSWIANAYFKKNGALVNYDMIIPSFNEVTQNEVIKAICNMVDIKICDQFSKVVNEVV